MRPAIATIHLENLLHNYWRLRQVADQARIMAIVKANAYGHGIFPVTETLFNAGCRDFAVTDAEEATTLWQQLPASMHQTIDITILSGPFDICDAQTIAEHGFSPAISTTDQFHLLQAAGFTGKVWLKVDTGMNRIGTENIKQLTQSINNSPMKLAGIMSHLACADTPQHPLNTQQISLFKNIKNNTDAPAYSLLNSAGVVAFSNNTQTNIIRPGIALYGSEPIPSRPLGLKPVMQLSAKILHIRTVQADTSVSYGASWVASKTTQVAIVSLGYADGLPRLLSNKGEAQHSSGRLPIIGKVCMDYCMLGVDKQHIDVGDKVTFFGDRPAPSVRDIASLCQTISYEILTGISPRVKRHYIKGAL